MEITHAIVREIEDEEVEYEVTVELCMTSKMITKEEK